MLVGIFKIYWLFHQNWHCYKVVHKPRWVFHTRRIGLSPVDFGQLDILALGFGGLGSNIIGTSLGWTPTSYVMRHSLFCISKKKAHKLICKCVTHFLIDDSTDGSLHCTWHGISSLCWKNITFLHVFLQQVRQWWIKRLSVTCVTHKWVFFPFFDRAMQHEGS